MTNFFSCVPTALLLLLHLLSHAALASGSSDQELLAPLPDDTARICPLPVCKTCPTAKQIHAPGIGFALEMGYGYGCDFLSVSVLAICF